MSAGISEPIFKNRFYDPNPFFQPVRHYFTHKEKQYLTGWLSNVNGLKFKN
jgi:hypothetical protein